MSTVIQELSGENVVLDRAYVSERVQDWCARLSSLYDEVASWLPAFDIDRTETVDMDEKVMREYDVAPVRLPVLRIADSQGPVASLVPRGLWVIGTNGRVVVFARRGQFVLTDRSETFASPRWEIAPALNRLDAHALSRQAFRQTFE